MGLRSTSTWICSRSATSTHCGYQGMAVTQMRDLGVTTPLPQLALSLSEH
jgi:hypothetical protein